MSEYRMDEQPMFRANADFMVIAGDTGRYSRTQHEIQSRTPASGEDAYEHRYQESLRRELYKLEARLTDNEFNEFDRYRSDIGNTSEQIYFLRLNRMQKEEYLTIRNIKERKVTKSNIALRPERGYVATNDVVLGMPMEKVLENWGTPYRRDIAGQVGENNERWAFRKNGVTKYVFFEDGIVQGWGED